MAQTNTETAADRFVEKWGNSELSERAARHEHFINLCRLIDQPTPASADATGEELHVRETGQSHALCLQGVKGDAGI